MTFPTPFLPADISPKPVHASGMFKLTKNFSGTAITLQKPSNGATQSFSFGSDGKLPVAAIDTFRAGEIVRVTNRADQIGGLNYVSDVTFGPKFGDLTIGAHRCMWFEGDAMVDNFTPTGQVYFMRADSIGALNVIANNMTVMQVWQIHNSAFCNQFNAPTVFRGSPFAMSSPAGTHTRLFAEANQAGAPSAVGGGGYTAEDGVGFRGSSYNAWMETSPVVLTYINGASGTLFGQNQDFRSMSSHSASTRVAVQAFIGCHEASLPPTIPQLNEAMGGAELATLFWNQALAPTQAAAVAASLYNAVPIDRLHSHSNAPLVLTMTDSIWAGYKGDDLRGWDKRAMLQLPTSVRFANFAVPGSGIIQPPGSTVPNSYTLGLFPGWIAQAIRQHRGRVHVVWGTPLNDYTSLTPPTPTPDFIYANATLALINLVRGIDPTATITLCTGTHSSNPNFENALGLGSTLIRNGAAANGYGVVDLWNDPFMQNTAVATKDGSHLSNAGWDRVATLILPRIQNWLQSLGPYP